MNRGDCRESIFKDSQDHQDIVRTLAEACGKVGWQVHADCLMPNHGRALGESVAGGDGHRAEQRGRRPVFCRGKAGVVKICLHGARTTWRKQ